MRKLGFAFGVAFFGMGIFISLYAEGLRRWYSGLFFIFIGIIVFLTALLRKGDSEKE
jgi:hypothetical protein